MKLVDNILYIEFFELVECGVSENTLFQAKSRKSKSWSFIDDPDDKRKVLIEYSKMSQNYKDLITNKYGNPYNHVARQPIKNMIKKDDLAEQFFINYTWDGIKKLSPEHIQKYTIAVQWLNMLQKANDDKKELKKLLNLTLDQFYVHVIDLIKIENVDLPSSYRRLLDAQKRYKEDGYQTLISWKFGNKLAAKVNDEVASSLLLEMIAHPNQFDDSIICNQYNAWAKANGYKTIDSATVGVHRRKNEHLIIGEREGNSAFNRKYSKQVKSSRPSFPLSLIESDDNHIDLQFIHFDKDGKQNNHARYIAIVVVDSYNDYVLGYAYSTKISKELINAAYINAMYHIRSLTNGWHLPHEIKTDNWSIATMKPFYKSLAHFEESATGSKNRGYIEQFFGSPHWKNCMKLGASNYTGNNITAINAGVNRDVVAANIKNRPVIGNDSIEQIEQFFYRLRFMPDSKGVVKNQQWLQAWENLPSDKKRKISDEQFLLKFGIEHNYNGNGIRITNGGVEPKINGIQHSYDLITYNTEDIGKKVSVLYDPFDMSRVLVTDFENFRMLAVDAKMPSRAFVEGDVDSRIYVSQMLAQKKADVKKVGDASDKRKEIIAPLFESGEAVLVSGVQKKEIKLEAEQKMLSNNNDKNNNSEKSFYDKY